MRFLKLLSLFVLVIFIEGIWSFPYRPDLYLIFMILVAVNSSPGSGMTVAFLSGFVQDAISSVNFVNTLVKTIIGALVLMIKDRYAVQKTSLLSIFVILFTPLAVIIKAYSKQLIYQEKIIWSLVFGDMLSTTILNILFLFLVLFIVKKFRLYG